MDPSPTMTNSLISPVLATCLCERYRQSEHNFKAGEGPYVPPQSSILIDRHFGLSMSNMISSMLAPMETHRTISGYRSPNLYKSTSISTPICEKTSGRLHVHSSYARDVEGVMQLDLPCIHLLCPSYRIPHDLLDSLQPRVTRARSIRIVQSKLSRRNKGSALVNVITEGFAQREVYEMGCGVVHLQSASAVLGSEVRLQLGGDCMECDLLDRPYT